MDVAEVFKAFDLDAEFTFLAGYVVEIDVLDCRREAAVADFSLLVYEIDFEDGLLALADLYVADKDVFDDTAAAGVGLDAYDAVEEGRVHDAVFYEEVFEAAGDFTAYDYTTVAVLHAAISYDHVLCGYAPCASVAVASALDGYAVVACVKEAVFDEYVFT